MQPPLPPLQHPSRQRRQRPGYWSTNSATCHLSVGRMPAPPAVPIAHLITTTLIQTVALTSNGPQTRFHRCKAPASTASKAPAKPTEDAKSAKKASSKPAAEPSDERKKRRKVYKETYSSYIGSP